MTLNEARFLMQSNIHYGLMMVETGDADGLIAGLTQHYPETVRPALQIIKPKEGKSTIAGLYMIMFRNRMLFFADTTINIDPTAEQLADIALLVADEVRRFDIEPKIAMLSYSSFGSVKHPTSEKMRRATELVKARRPNLIVEGEMQADIALSPELLDTLYPFSKLKGEANVMIFPDLASSTIAAKLLLKLANAETVGPILMGMNKPVHLLQTSNDVNDIVNMTAVAVMEAQELT
jgi:malate dehydrogenase (oxaloacetate-decarboxylating)(NADP+)